LIRAGKSIPLLAEGINILDASCARNHRLAIADPQFADIALQYLK
jgi:hypothetical protein